MGKVEEMIKSISLDALMILVCVIPTSCTISFQNVMTHGVASDVGESDPSTEAEAEAEIPLAKIGTTAIP